MLPASCLQYTQRVLCSTVLSVRASGFKHKLAYASELDDALRARIQKLHKPVTLVDDALTPMRVLPAISCSDDPWPDVHCNMHAAEDGMVLSIYMGQECRASHIPKWVWDAALRITVICLARPCA